MFKSRSILVGFFVFLLAFLTWAFARPSLHLLKVVWNDADARSGLPLGWADDVSRMNRTRILPPVMVASHVKEAEDQLRRVLRQAAAEKKSVSIAGARHSMGGQTISPDGFLIDMLPLCHMELQEESGILRVGAGARWSEILEFLAGRDRCIEIMQSNSSFTVGGSLSVNCHGWQICRPPIASTVDSFRLMLADGSVVRCARDENEELFRLALGGYGLFGIILDADIRTCVDEVYTLKSELFLADNLEQVFDRLKEESPAARLAFARLCIVPGDDTFLKEGVWNVFRLAGDARKADVRNPSRWHDAARLLFRGSEASDYGKELRWNAERTFAIGLSGSVFRRHDVMNQAVETIENRSKESTDILHEYFVPVGKTRAFLAGLRRTIPTHDIDLLNVTVREVLADEESFLRYACTPSFSFVMLFVQLRTSAGEAEMAGLTRELIDLVISVDGTYYLPYRLHATKEQFHKAYPMGAEFFALKKKYDPQLRFQNQFWLQYAR